MRALFVVGLVACGLGASATQRFSFAGLTWGDSLSSAEAKLQAAGHSSLFVEKLWPDKPAQKLLFRRFTGQVGGHAFKGLLVLHDGKLSQVLLTWDARNGNERAIEALFVTRYGKPRRLGPPDYELEWTSNFGERLEVDTNMRFGEGSIIASYLSPDALRRGHQAQAEYEARQRKRKQEASAQERKTASGL